MKRGFTLIELSIVLVIVGLLIGGILVGQSLIESAKINAQVSQIQQFDAGVLAFKAKYKGLPGDSKFFGGDGDGYVDAGPGWVPNYVAAYLCEIGNFWNNIEPIKFANYPCISPGPTRVITSGTGVNVPMAKLGQKGSFFLALALATVNDEVADSANKSNYYSMLKSTQAQTITSGEYRLTSTTNANSAASPSELLAIDQKLDDGVANMGSVISGRIGSFGGRPWGGIEPLPATGTCSSGATYTVSNSASECTPLIRIGAQGGNPL